MGAGGGGGGVGACRIFTNKDKLDVTVLSLSFNTKYVKSPINFNCCVNKN